MKSAMHCNSLPVIFIPPTPERSEQQHTIFCYKTGRIIRHLSADELGNLPANPAYVLNTILSHQVSPIWLDSSPDNLAIRYRTLPAEYLLFCFHVGNKHFEPSEYRFSQAHLTLKNQALRCLQDNPLVAAPLQHACLQLTNYLAIAGRSNMQGSNKRPFLRKWPTEKRFLKAIIKDPFYTLRDIPRECQRQISKVLLAEEASETWEKTTINKNAAINRTAASNGFTSFHLAKEQMKDSFGDITQGMDTITPIPKKEKKKKLTIKKKEELSVNAFSSVFGIEV